MLRTDIIQMDSCKIAVACSPNSYINCTGEWGNQAKIIGCHNVYGATENQIWFVSNKTYDAPTTRHDFPCNCHQWQRMAEANMIQTWSIHFIMTNITILYTSSFNKGLKKSIPGDAWTPVLQVPIGVFHGTQVWKFGVNNHFLPTGVTIESPMFHIFNWNIDMWLS